jgi:predicted HicB family RNase H-like nuclease
MEYQGYSAKIEYDENLGTFHGQVLNINDVITFQGTSVEELGREFAASVDDYLAWCEERGEPPEKPYSGRFLLRVDPDLHRQVALAAAREGVSLNAWAASVLEGAVSAEEGAGHEATVKGRPHRAPLPR